MIHITCSKKVNARAIEIEIEIEKGWGIGVFFDESSLVLMDGNVHVSRAQSTVVRAKFSRWLGFGGCQCKKINAKKDRQRPHLGRRAAALLLS